MSTDHSDTWPRYQWRLRLIGRHLDRHGAVTAWIVEEPGGFVVGHSRQPNSPDLIETRFSFRQLEALEREMLAGRRRRSPQPAGRYKDLLRALGFELEQQHAYSILIVEVEDTFVVTYQYLDPSQGYLVRKHMAAIDAGTRDHLLIQARARRKPDRGQRRSLRDLFA